MRIAIGFYGLVGSKVNKNGIGEALDPSEAFKFYKKNIFKVNSNIDVFIHTWSHEQKNQLEKLYKPIKSLYQKQIPFISSKTHPEIDSFKKNNYLKKLFFPNRYQNQLNELKKSSFRAHSRWYSNKQVLNLINSHEKKQKLKYDFIMVTRLDVGFFKKLEFKSLDKNVFYAGYRNNAPNKSNNFKGDHNNEYLGKEFNDLWFISNSKNMNRLSKLFDNINNYKISPHISSYQHTIEFIKPEKIKYFLYRWFDYELIRRKFYDSSI